MGGGHTTHYDAFKSDQINNIKNEEQKLEKQKQYFKGMEIHETDALKFL